MDGKEQEIRILGIPLCLVDSEPSYRFAACAGIGLSKSQDLKLFMDAALQVLYTESGSSISCHEKLWLQYRQDFPPLLRNKIESFRDWRDRQLNLLGKLLICRALESYGTIQDILGAYTLDMHGRPFVNLPGVPDFNVSHSGKYAVCAALSGGGRVGIDIELVRDVNFSDFESFFPQDVWKMIMQSSDKVRTFYNYWTILESIAKAHGTGIGGPVKDIRIQGKKAEYCGQTWNFSEIKIFPEYSCHIAANIAISAAVGQGFIY